MTEHANIRIFGEVQGVGFRYAVRQKARETGLAGFVRNEPDESVYIEVEGKEETLKKFIEWCKEGPSYAEVKRVEAAFSPTLKGFHDFIIEHQTRS